MAKSPDAFRTISEVAAWLETPAHVLRFWESKFVQIKPVKRAGGRRYYRPDDIALLGGIKVLLHDKGMTIKGVQNLLRERGPRHVATLSPLPWEGELVDGAAEPLDGALHGGAVGGSPAAPGGGAADGAADGGADGGPTDGADEADAVIVGPWQGAGLPDGAAEQGTPFDPASGVPPNGPEDGRAAHPAPVPPASPTLLDEFLAGTLARLGRESPEEPPGWERLRRALRDADPERLRARADAIRPLVARLEALRARP